MCSNNGSSDYTPKINPSDTITTHTRHLHCNCYLLATEKIIINPSVFSTKWTLPRDPASPGGWRNTPGFWWARGSRYRGPGWARGRNWDVHPHPHCGPADSTHSNDSGGSGACAGTGTSASSPAHEAGSATRLRSTFGGCWNWEKIANGFDVKQTLVIILRCLTIHQLIRSKALTHVINWKKWGNFILKL